MIINTGVYSGMKFVFPFQDEMVLWEVGESLGGDRWVCRTTKGTFMGRDFTNEIYQGIEVAFDESHILTCLAMDNQIVRVNLHLDKERGTKWHAATNGSSDTKVISSVPV